jgi:MFS family permease
MWFAATAVAPELRARWALTAGETGWLTSTVQLGFVAGTLAVAALNLADVIPSRALFAAAAVAGAGSNALLLAVHGYPAALGVRFATGFCLAGVYPPALKMAATWFSSGRGLATGTVVGALVGIGYTDGPFAFPRRPFSLRLVGDVLREPRVRLATAGYLGHMWELYALWAWIAAFLAASAHAREALGFRVPGEGALRLLAFGAIAIGAVGCVWGGHLADRIGRERLVIAALAASGSCAILSSVAFGRSGLLLVPLVGIWGIAVVADSAQFSALVTETAPAHGVGTALTLQTSLGFLLTLVTIQLVPVIVGAAGWRFAFPALAAGPALGIMAIARLRTLRAR